MKIILLVFFIWWTLASIRGLLKTTTLSVQEQADKLSIDITKMQSMLRVLAVVLILAIPAIYAMATVYIKNPLTIIGSIIAIGLALYGYIQVRGQIIKGLIIAKPSLIGFYSVLFKSYVIFELAKTISFPGAA